MVFFRKHQNGSFEDLESTQSWAYSSVLKVEKFPALCN